MKWCSHSHSLVSLELHGVRLQQNLIQIFLILLIMRKFPYSVSIDYLCPKSEIEFAFYQLGKYAK